MSIAHLCGVALMGRGLTGRSAHLNAPSVHHLCKSILLENTASTKVRSAYAYTGRVSCVRDDATDRTKRHGYRRSSDAAVPPPQTDCSDPRTKKDSTSLLYL